MRLLSVESGGADRVQVARTRADDYLIKKLAFLESLARVRDLLRASLAPRNSPARRVFVVLHQNGSHGPSAEPSIVPDVQNKVPFVVWMSEALQRQRGVDAARLARATAHSQANVFHSVMGAFGR